MYITYVHSVTDSMYIHIYHICALPGSCQWSPWCILSRTTYVYYICAFCHGHHVWIHIDSMHIYIYHICALPGPCPWSTWCIPSRTAYVYHTCAFCHGQRVFIYIYLMCAFPGSCPWKALLVEYRALLKKHFLSHEPLFQSPEYRLFDRI